MATQPIIGVVYDALTLAPKRIIDLSLDHHPTRGLIPAANPDYSTLVPGPIGNGEAMAIIPKSQVVGLDLHGIARAAILRTLGR